MVNSYQSNIQPLAVTKTSMDVSKQCTSKKSYPSLKMSLIIDSEVPSHPRLLSSVPITHVSLWLLQSKTDLESAYPCHKHIED